MQHTRHRRAAALLFTNLADREVDAAVDPSFDGVAVVAVNLLSRVTPCP
jgi:hypothetical protein